MPVNVEVMDEDLAETAWGPQNPFFEPSSLPFGAPRFDAIKDSDYLPGFLAGMRAQVAEVAGITQVVDSATFANTVEALERTGRLLTRVAAAFFCVAGAHTNEEVQRIQQVMAPRLSAHSDGIYLDAGLFARVKAVFDARVSTVTDTEQLRVLTETYRGFVRAGALLSDEQKERMKVLNAETATLQAGFVNKVLRAAREGALVVATREELAGLSEAEILVAEAAAKERGVEGFLLPLVNTTQQPVMAQLENGETRRRLWERSLSRNEQGDANDTRADVVRLAQLRAERAALLGHASYAAWKLEDQMAQVPGNAVAFLDRLVPAARASVEAEEGQIREEKRRQETIKADQGGERLQIGEGGRDGFGGVGAVEAWDWNFYAERVRRARFDLDEEAVRPYFELTRVFEGGVLFAATALYGITFAVRTDLPVWHPDVVTYEVFDHDGSHLALLYVDFYKRDSKRGGAWMSSLVGQSRLLGEQPIICNVCNYAKPVEGQPTLLSADEVDTLFHEFGHALHGLFSDVMYPSLAGTAVARDFVEFPSQFNEHWASEPGVFAHYARHYSTGEAMPAALVAKVRAAKNFNGGHALAEVLAAAEMDLEWHTLGAGAALQDAANFEREALERKGVAFGAVPPRYRSSYFSHIFGGGYAAGYYAYLWAEMLDADAFAWFEEHGGLTRENGERLRRMVLARGNSADPAALYREWRGRDAVIGPMLRGRGLVLAESVAVQKN